MSKKVMRLTLVISSLLPGGAERVMSIMANYWAAKGWQITLITFDDGMIPPFYELDSRIHHKPLGIAGNASNLIGALWNNLKQVYTIRHAIMESDPDAVISFMEMTNVSTLLATRCLNMPVVVSEHTDTMIHSIHRKQELLRWWIYPVADRIVVLSPRALEYFLPKFQNSTQIIPNPVLRPPADYVSCARLLVEPSVIAMGRFSEVKHFDLLIRAFAKLKDQHPEWTLTILGEGHLRAELESLRDALGLIDRIHLPGTVKNSTEFLMQADIYVMSSLYEGFPMALCEAMACGLPVISTDCSGSKEVIRNGIDGVLVPLDDVDALAAAMDRLMSDEAERKRLGSRAVEITERFGLEKVMEMWENVLEQVIEMKKT